MIVLLLVGGGLVIGFLRGFVTEVVLLLAWVAAIIGLKFLHGPMTDLLNGFVGTWGAAAILAFALIFLVIFIAARLAARQLGGVTKKSLIGPVDRALGAGFGALKGLVGATLLFLLANLVYDTIFGRIAARPAWMAQSRTYPLLNASGRAIIDFVEARRRAGEAEDSRQAQAEPRNRT
jgi:membrane protein required for colicin V production